MAFGPATAGIEQVVQALMQGRPPSPLTPSPETDTSGALAALTAAPPLPAPPPPVDADAIRSRFAGLAGPEPVAPTSEPTSVILQIARALQGFGAGVQGQGPQFLEGLRQERERPQREFQAKKERFDTRKQELGVMAEQAVMSAEDRRARRAEDLIDRQSDRDFQEAKTKAGLKSAEAIEQMREAFNLERDAKKAEFKRQEDERRDAKERKTAIGKQADVMMDDFKGVSREEAIRFATHEIDGTPLSAADAKKYSRIEKYRAPAGGGAGGANSKVMVEIRNPDGSLSVIPFTVAAAGINSGAVQMGPRGVFMQGQAAPAAPPPVPAPSQVMSQFEPSPSGQLSPQQPTPINHGFSRAQVEAYAKKTGRDPAAVEADIRARGGTVQ